MNDERPFMTRSFWPVGQGAFYSEKSIDGSIVVYDCGSQKPSALNKILNSQFNTGQKIDCVFISHMHDDHINGLKLLLEQCNVKKVVLPYIYKKDKKYLKINSMLSRNKNRLLRPTFTDRMIDDAVDAIKSISYRTEITFVMPAEQEWEKESYTSRHELSEFRNEIEKSAGVSTINSGEDINHNSEWIYIPYNMHYTEKVELFAEALRKKMGLELNDLSPTTVAALWLKDETFGQRIKAVYQTLANDLNTTSMVVYSGPSGEYTGRMYLYNHPYHPYQLYYRPYHVNYIKDVGALYTGDYNAKSSYDILKKFYDRYSNNIGIVQIPHHGAIESFNAELIKPHRICIISAGEKNSYNHPSDDVINDIYFYGANLFTVTEDSVTAVHAQIYITYNNVEI